MSLFKLQFAGEARKVQSRMAADKQVIEFQLCKKDKGRNGAEDAFTWARVTLWQPAQFQLDKIVDGIMVAGCGDFSLRSYEKDGVKRQSAEVRCSSFDVEIGGMVSKGDVAPVAATGGGSSGQDDGPPFIPLSHWG